MNTKTEILAAIVFVLMFAFVIVLACVDTSADTISEPTTAATTEETTEAATEPTETEVPTEVTTEPTEAHTYTEDELEMMALVIYLEAGGDGCSDDTRLMVGTVVMNRVEDSRFPNTIYDVLMQKQQYGRFYWTGLVWPARASNPGEAHAVERAYKCAEQILSGYRSFESGVVWQAEFVQGSEIVAYQDGIYFCK